jgi:glycerol-3-phosphate acyltransferase PlsY
MIVLTAIVAYLLGCLPTAYLVMRRTHGIDIRNHGTGNVGAMNTYDVSGRKRLGLFVMLVDALKGALAVAFGAWLDDGAMPHVGVAALFVILGHTYNVFLGWKGGRGLATAMGVFLVVNPLAVVLWDVMYLTGYYAIRRNIHIASMTGTIGVAVLIWSTPYAVLDITNVAHVLDPSAVRMVVFVCSLPLFARHIAPVRDALRAEDAADT